MQWCIKNTVCFLKKWTVEWRPYTGKAIRIFLKRAVIRREPKGLWEVRRGSGLRQAGRQQPSNRLELGGPGGRIRGGLARWKIQVFLWGWLMGCVAGSCGAREVRARAERRSSGERRGELLNWEVHPQGVISLPYLEAPHPQLPRAFHLLCKPQVWGAQKLERDPTNELILWNKWMNTA